MGYHNTTEKSRRGVSFHVKSLWLIVLDRRFSECLDAAAKPHNDVIRSSNKLNCTKRMSSVFDTPLASHHCFFRKVTS